MQDATPFKTTAHILSAATIAVLSNPGAWKVVNENTTKQLDFAFKNDRTWNPVLMRFAYLRINEHGEEEEVAKRAAATVSKRGQLPFWEA